ncbi:hypothetical protein MRX96_054547 [Rhipicephalus microplus]
MQPLTASLTDSFESRSVRRPSVAMNVITVHEQTRDTNATRHIHCTLIWLSSRRRGIETDRRAHGNRRRPHPYIEGRSFFLERTRHCSAIFPHAAVDDGNKEAPCQNAHVCDFATSSFSF